MKNIKVNEVEARIIKGIARMLVSLFLLTSLYYMIWSFVRWDDFSSLIIYPLAMAACIMSIERFLLNKSSFITFSILTVVLFLLGILKDVL